MMKSFPNLEVWFVTGSQHLYGPEALRQVSLDAETVASGLTESVSIPLQVTFKPIVTRPEEILQTCLEANNASQCVGLICWMHTFSPAKMWIAGLQALNKPFMHLHTQFSRDLPWSTIDMDYMNLHQSAHGGREFGFIGTRLRKERKVVVGHWQDTAVQAQVGGWTRAAAGWHESHRVKVARFGDNMREVAVTEGDKVSAQIQFGYSVHGYGLEELNASITAVTDQTVDSLVAEYKDCYQIGDQILKSDSLMAKVRMEARVEAGMKAFLDDHGCTAYTDTFENLAGLDMLPGMATQRLMAQGYGFGAEGDWKTAALLRVTKVMSSGLSGGTSFMEDYTYHFAPGQNQVLGSHMLEICPSIADRKPSLEIHPLGIGGKADPVRLVFNSPAGPALNASVIDLGNRYRLLINEVDAVEPPEDLPKLPVARTVWEPKPDLSTAAAAWIHAGGAHHTVYTQALTSEHFADFAEMAGIEMVLIDDKTTIRELKNELRWNELYYHFSGGF